MCLDQTDRLERVQVEYFDVAVAVTGGQVGAQRRDLETAGAQFTVAAAVVVYRLITGELEVAVDGGHGQIGHGWSTSL